METEKLWAEYGRLQAKREQLQNVVVQLTAQLRKIYAEILEAEHKQKSEKKEE